MIERLTPTGADTIRYEAAIDDPKVYSQPWKIQFDIGRNRQPGYELMEFACDENNLDRDGGHLGAGPHQPEKYGAHK